MRTSLVLIICFVAVICAAAMRATAWTTVPDPTDPKIQGLGLWAVVEHNKHAQADDQVTFRLVWSAGTQDFDYRMAIYGRDATHENGDYTAVVRTDASGNAVKLISFDTNP